MPTLRTTLTRTALLLVGLVAMVAVWVDVRAAALVLAGGLLVAAVLRLVLPDGQVPVGRGRVFDVTALLLLAVAAAVLAPWGLATAP